MPKKPVKLDPAAVEATIKEMIGELKPIKIEPIDFGAILNDGVFSNERIAQLLQRTQADSEAHFREIMSEIEPKGKPSFDPELLRRLKDVGSRTPNFDFFKPKDTQENPWEHFRPKPPKKAEAKTQDLSVVPHTPKK